MPCGRAICPAAVHGRGSSRTAAAGGWWSVSASASAACPANAAGKDVRPHDRTRGPASASCGMSCIMKASTCRVAARKAKACSCPECRRSSLVTPRQQPCAALVRERRPTARPDSVSGKCAVRNVMHHVSFNLSGSCVKANACNCLGCRTSSLVTPRQQPCSRAAPNSRHARLWQTRR